MRIRELTVPDAFEFTPVIHADTRGAFLEFYRFEALEEVIGHPLELRQGNISVSSRGVVRGVHYAIVPPGQAKFVHAPHGAFYDYVIDIRVGSPTFGQWDRVLIDDLERKAVYLAEGLGHLLVALTDGATASYLTSTVYTPEREFTIDPRDPQLALELPFEGDELLVSPRDAAAPSLAEALERGLLPDFEECRRFYRAARGEA
ncbi:dTDP-4-dehydrorhamnose 3,5-epimerase family protein [Protaetiibacter larvae]|uniref:dTDP-4-keto-6-deoxy-D-glucose epimerase n=1 Tax=Protaetiibacter larvae TaxID=2592654 RepID=A0A5C1Y5G6_9MICO|nr:dTDP-4-dehydrorhamnose 3,5-epimerase family protein [Protaetiibacter larvae]QEO08638.1 dTDP-4-keto-6-deoxy-D-glucose epimerase [Protaetiibacter larvae]